MTRTRVLQIAFFALVLLVVTMVLADPLDAPWLRLAALPLVFAAGIAYEMWRWWGHGRMWLIVYGTTFVGLVVVAAVAVAVSG